MIKNLRKVFAGFLLLSFSAVAQPPGYAFKAVSGSYTPLLGGTAVTLTYNGAANYDDGIATPANAIPIGFSFTYNGTAYTSIRPCANGFASFSTTALANNTDTWTNNLSSGPAANQRPIIAPWWDDLDMGASGAVTYQLSGTAPNRVLTIEWNGAKWEYPATAAVISFQVKLYETTNIIEFVYRQDAGSPASSGDLGVSIGLSATATGGFLSLSDAGTNPSVSAATESTAITTRPATGQIYRWIPYCTAAATNTTGEKISNFTFNTINNNSSSTAGYENFSNLITTVSLFPNAIVPFSVGVSGFTSTDQVSIYIDMNQNGDFSDAGENVYTSTTPLASGTVSGNITIPALSAAVLQGRTRIRVRLHDTGNGPNGTSCGSSTAGQVEDYSIDIQPCFAAVVTSQPPNTSICNGGTGSINATINGTGLTYQWQLSTNGGSTWSALSNNATYSGTATSSLTITGATLAMNGYKYRVIVNGTCTAANLASSAATLSVNAPAAITSSPVLQIVCESTAASFTVGASGTNPAYQWQVSTDGGFNYSNIAGATAATYPIPSAGMSLTLNRYRAVVSVTACGAVTSGAAILKVNPTPVVTLYAAPLSQLMPWVNTTLFATSNPAAAGYAWTYNGSPVSGGTNGTLPVSVDQLGSYAAKITDINGCTNTTNVVTITAEKSPDLFIYPNPSTDGLFHVRLFSLILSDRRTISIYNAAGALVDQKQFATSAPYQVTDFDFRRMAPGVYTVVVRHLHENKTAIGRIVIK